MSKSKTATIEADKINYVHFSKAVVEKHKIRKAFIDFHLDGVRSRIEVVIKNLPHE